MNILYLNPGSNPAMDNLYHGLVTLEHTVIEYPLLSYLHSFDLNLTSTNFSSNTDTPENIVKKCKENYFDFLCVGSNAEREVATWYYKFLHATHAPFCVVDASGMNLPLNWNDHPYAGRIPIVKFCRVKPKMEKEDCLLMGVRRDWKEPKHEKSAKWKFLASFLGILHTHRNSAFYRRILIRDTFEYFENTLFNSVCTFAGEDYYQKLKESLTSINVKGMVWDCRRFWEILTVGACLITEDMEKIIDFNPPFNDRETYLKFRYIFDYETNEDINVIDNLKSVLKFVKDNVAEVNKIAIRGNEFAMDCHSTINRAKQVINWFK